MRLRFAEYLPAKEEPSIIADGTMGMTYKKLIIINSI
jgi:hypothetical protein